MMPSQLKERLLCLSATVRVAEALGYTSQKEYRIIDEIVSEFDTITQQAHDAERALYNVMALLKIACDARGSLWEAPVMEDAREVLARIPT